MNFRLSSIVVAVMAFAATTAIGAPIPKPDDTRSALRTCNYHSFNVPRELVFERAYMYMVLPLFVVCRSPVRPSGTGRLQIMFKMVVLYVTFKWRLVKQNKNKKTGLFVWRIYVSICD
jgi:hypothetical protein